MSGRKVSTRPDGDVVRVLTRRHYDVIVVYMDITQYVDTLRADLGNAARAMGEDTAQVAERLGFALDSSFRLALMDALSHAAAEITTHLDGTSVEVRLQGREPVFVVLGGGATATAPIPTEPTELLDEESAETARITLRLPEVLKSRAEELASGRGQSLNTWLVNAVRAAATSGLTINLTTPMGPGAPGRNRSTNKRVQGWVR